MTVLAGVITVLVSVVSTLVIALVIGLILEETLGAGFIGVILAWIGLVFDAMFAAVVVACWVWAMFHGYNPIEAFSYQMWG